MKKFLPYSFFNGALFSAKDLRYLTVKAPYFFTIFLCAFPEYMLVGRARTIDKRR